MIEEIIEPTIPSIGPFFRFPDETIGMEALNNAGLLVEDPETKEKMPIMASHQHALDIIGPIYHGGEYDQDGEVITPPELIPGWHINYQGPLPDGWEEFVVYPQNPHRVFA